MKSYTKLTLNRFISSGCVCWDFVGLTDVGEVLGADLLDLVEAGVKVGRLFG